MDDYEPATAALETADASGHSRGEPAQSHPPSAPGPQSTLHSDSTAATTPPAPQPHDSASSKLKVFVRIRPLLSHEVAAGATAVAQPVDDKVVVLTEPRDETDILRRNRQRERHYALDAAFGESSTAAEVYARTAKPLLKSVLNGYNATVFAYGPTGAGKTHTMLGTQSQPGLMLLTLVDLFQRIEKRQKEYQWQVLMSYVEIYNERLFDLLVEHSEELELRDDGHGQALVVGATVVPINSPQEVMRLLYEGNMRRTQESTAANAQSSRSHAILSLQVQRTNIGPAAGAAPASHLGHLFMCDLAGSERAAQTKNFGQRMVEGQHINRSLLALGNCINALGGQHSNRGPSYVNYRDSKLTRLLKDALGGNCRTVMIAHVSPANFHFDESYNTLNYAIRARNIKTKITHNEQKVTTPISEYATVIEALRQQVSRLKSKLAAQQHHQHPQQQYSFGSSPDHMAHTTYQAREALPAVASSAPTTSSALLDFQRALQSLQTEALGIYRELNNLRHNEMQATAQQRSRLQRLKQEDPCHGRNEESHDDTEDDAVPLEDAASTSIEAELTLQRQAAAANAERAAVLHQRIQQIQAVSLTAYRDASEQFTTDGAGLELLSHLHELFLAKLREAATTSMQEMSLQVVQHLQESYTWSRDGIALRDEVIDRQHELMDDVMRAAVPAQLMRRLQTEREIAALLARLDQQDGGLARQATVLPALWRETTMSTATYEATRPKQPTVDSQPDFNATFTFRKSPARQLLRETTQPIGDGSSAKVEQPGADTSSAKSPQPPATLVSREATPGADDDDVFRAANALIAAGLPSRNSADERVRKRRTPFAGTTTAVQGSTAVVREPRRRSAVRFEAPRIDIAAAGFPSANSVPYSRPAAPPLVTGPVAPISSQAVPLQEAGASKMHLPADFNNGSKNAGGARHAGNKRRQALPTRTAAVADNWGFDSLAIVASSPYAAPVRAARSRPHY